MRLVTPFQEVSFFENLHHVYLRAQQTKLSDNRRLIYTYIYLAVTRHTHKQASECNVYMYALESNSAEKKSTVIRNREFK